MPWQKQSHNSSRTDVPCVLNQQLRVLLKLWFCNYWKGWQFEPKCYQAACGELLSKVFKPDLIQGYNKSWTSEQGQPSTPLLMKRCMKTWLPTEQHNKKAHPLLHCKSVMNICVAPEMHRRQSFLRQLALFRIFSIQTHPPISSILTFNMLRLSGWQWQHLASPLAGFSLDFIFSFHPVA